MAYNFVVEYWTRSLECVGSNRVRSSSVFFFCFGCVHLHCLFLSFMYNTCTCTLPLLLMSTLQESVLDYWKGYSDEISKWSGAGDVC